MTERRQKHLQNAGKEAETLTKCLKGGRNTYKMLERRQKRLQNGQMEAETLAKCLKGGRNA